MATTAMNRAIDFTPLNGPITRWTPKCKEKVLLAIKAEVLTHAEAVVQFGLSEEELTRWRVAYALYGLPGLSVCKHQRVRNASRLRSFPSV